MPTLLDLVALDISHLASNPITFGMTMPELILVGTRFVHHQQNRWFKPDSDHDESPHPCLLDKLPRSSAREHGLLSKLRESI
jgi:hypothetical protein